MSDQQHQRRIERWLRLGVAVVVPATVVIGLWLLLFKPETPPPAQPTDGSAHVVAFPAQPGPPTITLTPAAPAGRPTASTP